MNENKGLVGAIRQNSLPLAKLAGQERHGKRLDDTSAMRHVRDVPPLVYNTLDLRDAQAVHMHGIQRSKGAKTAAIHAFVQFPTDLIDGDDFMQQQRMLIGAVQFMNKVHGGDAVFAARLDCDEKGRHGVDVFLMPRYRVKYKDGREVTKASPSKFSKAEAKRRFGRDDVRAQGSALQDAWYEYLRDEMRLEGVQPPERKALSVKDRLEPEAYGLQKDRRRLDAERDQQASILSTAQRQILADRQRVERDRAMIQQQARILRNLQVAAGRQVSRALDDLTEVRENER